jgi:PAS domain S-box-containing protein
LARAKSTPRKNHLVQEQDLQFRSIIEKSNDTFILYNPQGIITYASPSIKKIGSYAQHEMVGRPGVDFIHAEDRALATAKFAEVLAKPRRSVVFELRLVRKNKSLFWAELVLTNMLKTRGVHAIVNNFRDISERKAAQEKRAEDKKLLHVLNTHLSEGIFMGIIGKRFTYANGAFLKLFGFRTFAELQRVKPAKLYLHDSQRLLLVADLMKKRKIEGGEAQFKRKNGEVFWGKLNASVFDLDDGSEGFIGTLKDVTAEKRAQQEIIDSQKFTDNILQVTTAPVFVKDAQHRWVMANEAFSKFLGRPLSEVLGKNDRDFLSDAQRKVFWRVDNEVLRTGKTIVNEEHVTDRDGNLREVITTKTRYVDGKGNKFIVAYLSDVTDERNASRSIRDLYQKLMAVLGSTNDRILALDTQFRYWVFNPAHARSMLGLTGKHIQPGDNILTLLPPPLASVARREISRALRGQAFTSENKLPNGLILETSYNPVRDKKKIVGVSLFIREINARKEAEQKMLQLNQQLKDQNIELARNKEELSETLKELAARNFELDQLMYKTSHDLRSPLSSIMGLVNLAKIDRHNQDDYLSKIEGRIKKLDEFVRSMLNYAKVSRKETVREPLDLQKLVEGCVQELAFLENYTAIRTTYHAQVTSEFYGDELLTKIIFGNIISNAFKYYRPTERSFLRISLRIDATQARIGFEDNGIGIRQEHIDKIYNMFYRATDRSEGSGLGMYIVKQAVDKLGGQIALKSRFGHGTHIQVTLPNRLTPLPHAVKP